MAALLDIIRGELADARRRIDQLERMEHLAIALEGDVGEDTGTPARDLDSSSPAGVAVGTAAGVLPPATTEPVVGAAGRRAETAETGHEPFAGRNGHQDAPVGKPARRKDPSAPGTAAPPQPRRAEAIAREDRLVAAVREHGPVAPGRLAELLDENFDSIRNGPLKRLIADGRLIATGNTSRRRIDIPVAERDATLAARATEGSPQQRGRNLRQIRDRIPVELARAPLTEVQLTDRLEADREDVAVVCGDLLEAGQVDLQPNGTYTLPRTQGGGRDHVPTTTAPAAHSRLQQAREAVTA